MGLIISYPLRTTAIEHLASLLTLGGMSNGLDSRIVSCVICADIAGMTPAFPSSSPSYSNGNDRRHNPRLRELVDEMLASIRIAANKDLWSAEERERCDADLERIMEAVRSKALEGRPPS